MKQTNESRSGTATTETIQEDNQGLTLRNIMKFLKAKEFPATNTRLFGVGLDVPFGTVEQFMRENPNLEDVLMFVINHWLCNDSAKSWDKLAEALRFCDCNNIADEIQRPPKGKRAAAAKEDQFPFLNLEGQDCDELIVRLKTESEEISRKFAILMAHALTMLKDQHITVNELIILIKKLPFPKNDSKNNLIPKLKRLENTDIITAFGEMSEYWSFLDYELLGTVIESFKSNSELITEYNNYVYEFTCYCKRRLCEVPIDAITAEKANPKNVKIKADSLFIVQLEDVKRMIGKLSLILGTSLRLVGFQEGCVELTFICMHELDALSAEQKQTLSQTKILKVYSDNEVYYESAKSGEYL